jgi:hypothetical protein
MTRITGTLHEDQYTFIYLAQFSLHWKIFHTGVVEKIKTHILCSIMSLFQKSCRLWDNVENDIVQPNGPQITIWRMRTACWICWATNTYSEYVIVIAFPLQQWLHERASVLRYTYTACLVLNSWKTSLRQALNYCGIVNSERLKCVICWLRALLAFWKV